MMLGTCDHIRDTPAYAFVLLGSTSLSRYVFADEAHARKWMAQPIVRGTNYRVRKFRVVRTKRICGCCGAHHLKTLGRGETVIVAPKAKPEAT
jgi:hypothetical protein